MPISDNLMTTLKLERLRHSNILTRRVKANAAQVEDYSGRTSTIAFDDVGAGLVLPSKKNVSRAIVIAVGPEVKHITPAQLITLPDEKQDSPLASWYDQDGDVMEIWREEQVHVACEIAEA